MLHFSQPHALQNPLLHNNDASSDYFRPNDFSPRLNNKRPIKEPLARAVFASPQSAPLSISTNLSSTPRPPSSSARSPYISSRQTASPVSFSPRPALKSPADSRRSSFSSVLEDVLAPGDIVAEGGMLNGEYIRLVSPLAPDAQHPAQEFEVVRRLGAGSYAVVYQVLEVLERAPPSEDGHSSMFGSMDLEGKFSRSPSTTYGREYAIKCLSKANLNTDALTAQMDEVTIHQSLHSHPNIVTLHRTLETPSFLLLLLEYVPGEDLFYFLEQARDHYESAQPTPDSEDPTMSVSRTPPTPSLLSTMNSSQLLSRTRLRLISSMFSQMCEAVAACHAQQVFHRDIKPENFIVTDGFVDVDGRRERKVIVKLTDFGLSTTDIESTDMDCGSAPYMSYECRNNVAPSYRPRAADVWSLGIVLINMLYHYNPWTDTKQGACNSFDLFRQQPVTFFMQRFVGMTRPVAEHLANKVFNVLDDPKDDSERISAAEFGIWAKDLPDLLGNPASGHGHQRAGSTASLTHGHRISCSIPFSHRPSSRQASGTASTVRTPAIQSRSLSRAASFGPAFDGAGASSKPETSELSTVIDQDAEEQEEEREYREYQDNDGRDSEAGTGSRSASNNKRRKRGARKGKGSNAAPSLKDETLETLAVASQSLAREISRASRAPSVKSTATHTSTTTRSSAASRRGQPFEPVAMYCLPLDMLGSPKPPVPPLPPLPPKIASTPVITHPHPPSHPHPHPPVPAQTVTKKPSKWKLSFGKSSAAALGRASPLEEAPPLDLPMTATASNVTNLIMGLNAPPPPPPPQMSATASNVTNLLNGLNAPAPPSVLPDDNWSRGRNRGRGPRSPGLGGIDGSRSREILYNPSLSPHPGAEHWAHDADQRSDRAVSPTSNRSGRPVASSASSMVSGNWRSSMSTTSSAGTSTSAFTRYSNSSTRSVSTTATSVSASSWRTGNGNGNGNKAAKGSNNNNNANVYPGLPPRNVKIMNGVPYEVFHLARGQYPNIPVIDASTSPPPTRQARTRKPKDLQLGTIAERTPAAQLSPVVQKSPEFPRQDAATSTTDLHGSPREEEGDGPKKVPKAQINALAKMLSALRQR